jgi:hypothetical protein
VKKIGFRLFGFLLILLLLYSSNFHISKLSTSNKNKRGEYRIVLIQETEKKEEEDSQYIALLKQVKEKVDGWLKSINERIEREDVTRLEVRFLEILRNILEWVNEKIDSKLESSKKGKPKERRNILKDTDVRYPLLFKKA